METCQHRYQLERKDFFPRTPWHDEQAKMPPEGYAKRVALLPLQ